MHCTLRHGLAALALLVAAAPAAASCWSAGDKADLAFDELQGETRLSFRDAVSCQPLAGAQVEVGGRSLRADALGEVRLDTRGMTDRRLPLTVRVDGYPEYTTELEIALGGALRKRFAISRRIDIDGLRFVLTWEAQPRDLDLHLEGPGFHVSYRDMRHHAGQARLDRDAQDGYGPETITLARADGGSRYDLYVVNYSRDAPIGPQARVGIYAQGRLYAEVSLPATRQERVAVAHIENGRIELRQ